MLTKKKFALKNLYENYDELRKLKCVRTLAAQNNFFFTF